ncbi:MAG: DNA polymerase-3 subunit gamma/tau, partial [Planctomycetota bacterium]
AALSGGRPLPASAATLAQAPAAAPSAAPSAAPAPAPTAPVSQADIPTPPRPSAPEAASSTSTSALTDGDVREWWKRALVILDRGQGAFAELLRTAAKPRVTQTGIDILIGDLDEKSKRMTDDRRSRSALSRALTEVAGRTLELRFVTDRSTGQAAPRPPQAAAPSPPDEAPQDPAPASPQDSPPVQDSSSRRTSQARNALPPRKPAAGTREKDGFTQEVADVFGGVVEDL